jgi:PAS domain S-box-containing protein
MTPLALQQRVQARDRLVQQAEQVQAQLQMDVRAALASGDLPHAQVAAEQHQKLLRDLAESLRTYQAELHAQADELAAAQERGEQLLTRFSALFSATPVATLLVGFNGELVEHNAKAATLFGLRHRAGVARFLQRMVDSSAYQLRVRPAFQEARDTGASALDSVTFMGEDGRYFIGELHIARLPGPDSGQMQFACAVIDRTEHLESLQALQVSTDALRQSVALLGDCARLARIGGWQLQLRPRQLHWSKELRDLLEIGDEEEATLEATLARCSQRDRSVFATAVAAAERGEAFDIELDMVSARGRRLRVLAVGRADRESSVVHRVTGVFQDISSRAQMGHQIDDMNERLSLANDASGIGIWDWNLDSGELVFDDRLCRLLVPGAGQAPAPRRQRADLGTALRPYLHADDAPLFTESVLRSLRRHEPLNQEMRCAVPDAGNGSDSGRWLHITGRAHFDEFGRPHRFVGCAWDSSPEHEAARLQAAKDAAESASRAKSAFLSRMSHELRTPLNAILGFSQLMRMEAEAGDLVLKPHRVALIETAARHLLDLVNEVLDVSRIESGQVQVLLSSFPLHEVVGEALPLVQGLADKAGVSLHDHLQGTTPLVVLGDRLRLKEVLINLLSNAVKYNVSGGRVDVRAQAQDDGMALSVADTGQGLDAVQLAGMFQPFNRLGAEASGIEGTGMGLFVSRRFVELMGGSIAVDSRPGAGTMFSIQLPVPRDS